MRDARFRGTLVGIAVALAIFEAGAYLAVRTLARGRAAFLFYQPPALTRADYEEYLAIRDPELGWPAPRELNGRRYDRSGSRWVPAFPAPGNACVSLYGDSFTYSDEVGHADAWGNVLAEWLGCRVANYGVGAYGTDQALLRFERHQRNGDDPAPVTVLGFFVRDVLRNVTQYLHLDFGNHPTAFKPRFVLDEGSVRAIPIPRIAPDDLALFADQPERFLADETFLPGSRLGGTRIGFPYALVLARVLTHERLRARVAGRPNWADFLTPGHSSGGLEVTVGTIKRFTDQCRARTKRCFVVVFPSPSSLDHLARTGTDPSHHLTASLARAGVDVLDLAPGIVRYLGGRSYQELLASTDGHHNAEGDRLVATLVHAHLVARGLVPPTPERPPVGHSR